MFLVCLFLLFRSFLYLPLQWYHPAGQNTHNRYAICNPDKPQEPNNWLRGPVVEVGDIQRLDVNFRYFSQQCSQSASFCKGSFYAYIWESNTSVTTEQIPHPIDDFQLYRRLPNVTRNSDQEKILTVPLHVANKYIALGIRDQGGCRTLFSVNFFIRFAWKRNLKTAWYSFCLLYTSPSPRDLSTSRMPSSA